MRVVFPTIYFSPTGVTAYVNVNFISKLLSSPSLVIVSFAVKMSLTMAMFVARYMY